jgi:hypothetical protein
MEPHRLLLKFRHGLLFGHTIIATLVALPVVAKAIGGRGVRGNFRDERSGEEFWISGIKKRGSNAHVHESTSVVIDAHRLTRPGGTNMLDM